MAQNQSRLFLLCYDVADPTRLGKVHRLLVKRGIPVQYSVFLLYGTTGTASECLAEVGELIDPREDDVRCYPLPAKAEYEHLGRQLVPEGLVLSANAGLPGLFSSAA